MTTDAASLRLTVVTLGVRDVRASAAFYEALGFVRKVRATSDEIAFIDAGGVVLALWDWEKLAADAAAAPEPKPQGFLGTTLAWNCRTPAEVDAAYARADLRPAASRYANPARPITAAIAATSPIPTAMSGRL